MQAERAKEIVREGYARIAERDGSCCADTSCCGGERKKTVSLSLGYSEEDVSRVPEGADLGLGCGNPTALAELKPGMCVVDLGSGAGFDCFLAADKVGKSGQVIGVDMTPEMVARARRNLAKGDYPQVEFRLGEIEALPVADAVADVVISNCVINLVPDKPRVFREAYRVLKPGGRLMVSDIVLLQPLPEVILESVRAYVGCISGASQKEEYLRAIRDAGFEPIEVLNERTFGLDWMLNDPTAQAILKDADLTPEDIEQLGIRVVSVEVRAVKPQG